MSEDQCETLSNIDYNLESIAGSLEAIRESLHCAFLQLSDEEQIALEIFVHTDAEAEASFRHAHAWVRERDRRRAEEKANAQPPI